MSKNVNPNDSAQQIRPFQLKVKFASSTKRKQTRGKFDEYPTQSQKSNNNATPFLATDKGQEVSPSDCHDNKLLNCISSNINTNTGDTEILNKVYRDWISLSSSSQDESSGQTDSAGIRSCTTVQQREEKNSSTTKSTGDQEQDHSPMKENIKESPFLLFAQSVHLYQNIADEGDDTIHVQIKETLSLSTTATSSDSSIQNSTSDTCTTNSSCPLLALPVPHDLLSQHLDIQQCFDGERDSNSSNTSTNRNIKNNQQHEYEQGKRGQSEECNWNFTNNNITNMTKGRLSSLLQHIHPELVQLDPCGLILQTISSDDVCSQKKQRVSSSSLPSSSFVPKSAFNLLLLRVPMLPIPSSVKSKERSLSKNVNSDIMMATAPTSATNSKNINNDNNNSDNTVHKSRLIRLMEVITLNGAPMAWNTNHDTITSNVSSTNVIQLLPISEITFQDEEVMEYESDYNANSLNIMGDVSQKQIVKSNNSNNQANKSSPTSAHHIYNEESKERKIEREGAVDDVQKCETKSLSLPSSSADRNSSSASQELPLCPVCLFRIEPHQLGLLLPKQHDRCSQCCDTVSVDLDNTNKNKSRISNEGVSNRGVICNNMKSLSPWPWPNYCVACHILQERLTRSGAKINTTDSTIPNNNNNSNNSSSILRDNIKKRPIYKHLKCYTCGMEETLWVCLTCGVVGCGWYSHGHAEQHFCEHSHPFSLELATQRIWDYRTSSFVQRDDLLNCPWMQQFLGATNRAAYHGAAMRGSGAGDNNSCSSDRQWGMSPVSAGAPKKALMVGKEYEALLLSALEDQAQHYEGQISRLYTELTAQNADKGKMTKDEMKQVESLENEIAKMRIEVDEASGCLLEAQAQEAGHRAKSQHLLHQQSVMKGVLDDIRERSRREQEGGKSLIETMEQQIEDLTSNLRIRQQIAQHEELNNAQIYGTTGRRKGGGKKKGYRRSRK